MPNIAGLDASTTLVAEIEGRQSIFFLDPFPRFDTGNEVRGDEVDLTGPRLEDGSLKAPRPDRVT